MKLTEIRQASNRELVRQLSELVEAHPDMRFGQLLVAFGFVESEKTNIYSPTDWDTKIRDPFDEEPTTTLVRVERTKARLNGQK